MRKLSTDGTLCTRMPVENNQMLNLWFKGTGQPKSTMQPWRVQQPSQGANHPDLGALPMDQLKQCIKSSAYMEVSKPQCANCQQTKCSLRNCPIAKLTMATTPQQEEYRAKENLASILRNLRAMPVKDCLGMIAELFEEESAKPGVDQQLFHTNEAGA